MSEKNTNIGLKIINIRELSFVNKLTDFIVDNFSEDKLDLNIGMFVRGSSDKNTVSLTVFVSYSFEDEEKNKKIEFIKLETETIFKLFDVSEDELKFLDENDEIYISDDLMNLFLDASIGAIRGMFAYKTASLPINLVLPLLDVSRFIKENSISESE
ncbi:hypothetical protein P700755_002724 [Psychroflexus torquis ATCC 700755]|uniref:Preprotein translocase subunit SecB n=1 Tax=Psychroflexus torquis (strain ATCC 700755 / CIP 106069 / ACAM 623) TaxID=313595 RepID=K4IG04_PSYTT|nr:hypothetical protein [Psychroflexus torquis]AFU69462.1 hypothetical protein P700755_002724 [Psychroflexus torquis ATCC 700755]